MRKAPLVLAALAASACTAEAAPVRFDCDARPGRVSEVGQTGPGPAYRISGRIAAREIAANRRWPAAGIVSIESGDEQSRAMLEATARTPDGPLDVALRLTRGPQTEVRTLGRIGLDEELHFLLTVSDGRARVEIGTMRSEAEIDLGTGARLAVGCAAGSFRFEELRLE